MNFSKINFSTSSPIYREKQSSPISKPSFKANEKSLKAGIAGLSAVAASAVAAMNMKANKITEADINFSVTVCGHGNVKGNSVDVPDFRFFIPDHRKKDFSLPIYEKYNYKGKTNTVILFRLHPNTDGLRINDNMSMLLNADIDIETARKLLQKMEQACIITHKTLPDGKVTYFVNSTHPNEFMANPKIKTIIANFLNEAKNSVENTKTISQNPKTTYNLKLSDINKVEINRAQDKDNQREVKDYLREFLKNNKKFTVVHDKITEGNQTKDITALLIPVNHDWDCVTVTIDRNIPEESCQGLLTYLISQQITNTEDPKFKAGIVDYFNSLTLKKNV